MALTVILPLGQYIDLVMFSDDRRAVTSSIVQSNSDDIGYGH